MIELTSSMMELNWELSRRLASEALSEMTSPGYTFEGVVRKALRVANLSGHTMMRAFLHLQLLDIMHGKQDFAAVKKLVDDAYPDQKEAEAQTTEVLAYYFLSRSVPSRPKDIYGAPIGELEKNVDLMQDALKNEQGPIPPQFLKLARENAQMLNTIKNRVQDYLMAVEAEEEEPEPEETRRIGFRQ